MDFSVSGYPDETLLRAVNRGMQIRGSVLLFGQIRRSDVIFVEIRIRITLKLSVVKI